MTMLELATNRYTTKKYNPTKKIATEKIEELKQIVRLSPSSINGQPWKFIFVSDEKVKNELAAASFFNEEKVREASHLVVFCAIDDVAVFEKQIQQHLHPGATAYFNQFLKPLPEAEVRAWMQHQVYLSIGFFLSACANMGIDSTPMEGINGAAYKKILSLEGYRPLVGVALGYRDSNDSNQPSLKPKTRLPITDVVVAIE